MQMPERVHIVLMSLKVYMKNQNLFRFKGGTSLGGKLWIMEGVKVLPFT